MMNPTLVGFLKKELAQAVRDPRMRIMLFVMPVIQMTLFGLALSNEVKNIRLKVFREPSDRLAQELEERCLASGWFVPVDGKPTADPYELIESGKADAVLVALAGGLTKAWERGSGPGRTSAGGQVQLLVDASNAVRGRAIEAYMKAILEKIIPSTLRGEELFSPPLVAPFDDGNNAGAIPASMQSSSGMGGGRGRGTITFDVRVLYNPSMNTAIFLVPGVMCLILCVLTVVLTSMSIAREKEMGTLETLISAPVETWEVILGKTLPYVIIGMVDVPLVLGVAIVLFGVPMRGAAWELALSAFVFICAAVSAGTLISTFAKNQQQAMMGGFLFMFPAIQLSGIMFPLDNIPPLIAWITYLNPLKYFVVLLRNIMLKGGEPGVVWPNLGAMACLSVIMVAVSFKRFHRTLN